MDPKFFRKYADIITEAEAAPAADPQEIAQTLQAKLKPEEQQAVIAMAQKIVGKPLDQLTPQEAQKYGPQVMKAMQGGLAEEQLTEINWKAAWDTAKTKLGSLGFLGAMGATSAAMMAGGDALSAGYPGGAFLLGLAVLAGNLGSFKDEYETHKKLQTTNDPDQQAQLKDKLYRLSL